MAKTRVSAGPRPRRYRNGDPRRMPEQRCDSCSPSAINGVLCHEQGCPDAWRDYSFECDECGCDFYRSEQFERLCRDCRPREPRRSRSIFRTRRAKGLPSA